MESEFGDQGNPQPDSAFNGRALASLGGPPSAYGSIRRSERSPRAVFAQSGYDPPANGEIGCFARPKADVSFGDEQHRRIWRTCIQSRGSLLGRHRSPSLTRACPVRMLVKENPTNQLREKQMEDAIQIDTRGDFGLWAIEVAKQIVADQGFELARAARDGSEEDVRVAGNDLGQAITNAMMEVFDGLTDAVSEE